MPRAAAAFNTSRRFIKGKDKASGGLVVAGARGHSVKEQLALTGIARERLRSLEFSTGLPEAAKLDEEVPAHARQEVVRLERRLRPQRVDELEARGRTERHRDRDRPIQLHDR